MGTKSNYKDGIAMKLEILMSCMHQTDDRLVTKSNITGNVTVINQCDHDGVVEYPTAHGTARIYSTTQRGLTKSRNMAIEKSTADICMLCDDDELFVDNYEQLILDAYQNLPQADVIIFKIINLRPSFSDQIQQLRFPKTMKVCSVQISFRRQRLLDTGVRFDTFLGAGSGNGAEEELKFLTDCKKAGLTIYYVPVEIASLSQDASTWFGGFTEQFFENRGTTTRYILGLPLASAYAFYYILRKKNMYIKDITPARTLKATFRGIFQNKISKQKRNMERTK